MMLKILLTGKLGQVGWELQRALLPLGEVIAIDSNELDLANGDAIRQMMRSLRPNLVVNPAAYTAVDRAEIEPDLAYAINAAAPGIFAEEAAALGAGVIHFSTDYVFDGEKTTPYTEQDAPNPLNVYGQSKLAGEQAVTQAGGAGLVLRTSWVYSTRRDCFVTKVLAWARKHQVLRIVDDQMGSPTWSRALAETLALMLASGGSDPLGLLRQHAGVYHLGGAGAVSRFGWAESILENDPDPASRVAQQLLPAKSIDFPQSTALRPHNAALDCTHFAQTFGLSLPDWQTALKLALDTV